MSARFLSSLGAILAVNRTVGIVLISLLFLGLGEQLWTPFLPAYLEAKIKLSDAGAVAGVAFSVLLAVGVYACLRNLFEAVCDVAGGRITTRLGDRGSLILFGALTVAGYVLFLAWDSPVAAIVATLLIVGWDPLSVPVTFTTVGAITTVGATVTRMSQGPRSRDRDAVAGGRVAAAGSRFAHDPDPFHAAPSAGTASAPRAGDRPELPPDAQAPPARRSLHALVRLARPRARGALPHDRAGAPIPHTSGSCLPCST